MTQPLQANPAVLDDRERLARLRGGVIGRDEDPVLQQLVLEASRVSALPIAAVTLVGRRANLVRASTGLPAGVRAAGGVARDQSLCQFTICQDAPLELVDLDAVPGVPRSALVVGTGCYYGVRLRVQAQPVGALCVLGDEAVQLSEPVKERLRSLAAEAEVRLELLYAAAQPEQAVLGSASSPAFGELRNQLAVLASGLHFAELAAVELGVPLGLLAGAVSGKITPEELTESLPLMKGLAEDGAELGAAQQDMRMALEMVSRTTAALEQSMASTALSPTTELAPALEAAGQLAHHVTKISGGVQWQARQPGLWVKAARPVVITAVAAALRIAAESRVQGAHAPLQASVEQRGDAVELRLEGLQGDASVQIAKVLAGVPALTVRAAQTGLSLVWPAA